MALLFLLFTLSVALPVQANDADRVLITAGPSWDGFTNRDGTGLYHEIIHEIYSKDFEIRHLYVSSNQANALVAGGRADLKLCETKIELPLRLGRYPMYENKFYALYRRDNISQWRGTETLRGKRLAWREGYYSQEDFPVSVKGQPVRTGKAALMMVILGRADFYIDDMTLIEESFVDASEAFDHKAYAVEPIGSRRYYPVFSSTARGELLQRKYEKGMEVLRASGKLGEIFRRWGFSLPAVK